jgi:hypothetical protein
MPAPTPWTPRGTKRSERSYSMRCPCPYTALDAFLSENQLCRPGLDDPRREPHAGRVVVFLRGEDRGQAAAGAGAEVVRDGVASRGIRHEAPRTGFPERDSDHAWRHAIDAPAPSSEPPWLPQDHRRRDRRNGPGRGSCRAPRVRRRADASAAREADAGRHHRADEEGQSVLRPRSGIPRTTTSPSRRQPPRVSIPRQ